MISRAKVLLFLFLLTPGVAFAQLSITDALYDAPGTDTGHEWISITTTESIDLTGYTLLEGGVHHVLKVAQGTTTLAAGERAIIATDAQTYLEDHRDYRGTIFKSSFSLSNTGETIAITDTSRKEVATYSYTAPPPQPKVVAPKKTTTVSKKSTNVATQQTAIVAAAESTTSAASQSNNVLWWTVGALVVVVVLGIGGVFLLDGEGSKVVETSPAQEEFEIE